MRSFKRFLEAYFSWLMYHLFYGNAICKNQDPLLSKWTSQQSGQCPSLFNEKGNSDV
eukprot:13752.XXX_1179883_1180053_1 [CDS] Oithona nana genome sequencing.